MGGQYELRRDTSILYRSIENAERQNEERKKTLFANLEEQLKAFDELIKTRLAEERDALAEYKAEKRNIEFIRDAYTAPHIAGTVRAQVPSPPDVGQTVRISPAGLASFALRIIVLLSACVFFT